MAFRVLMMGAAAILLLSACTDPAPPTKSSPPATGEHGPRAAAARLPLPDVHPDPLAVPPVLGSESPEAQRINQATWTATPAAPQDRRDALIRAEVLLARAHFSPGVIDGQTGENLKNAIAAFQSANHMSVDGAMSPAVWDALTSDSQPALTDYVITADDVKGPFVAAIPTDYREMSKLAALSYTSPLQALAEKFHMDQALLTALNPDADFSVAGTRIVVAALGPDRLPAAVGRIEVDKTRRQVRAYGPGDVLLAVYPATVGSAERPAPDGQWAVQGVARNPTYTYDPAKLTFGKPGLGKLTIKPGPNNPVGSTWIDLTIPTYGIHGTPDPRRVGKVASHGCVRLTNWDAAELAAAVKPGVPVVFVGRETTSSAD